MGQPYEAIRLHGVPWGHGALSNPIDAYGADPMESTAPQGSVTACWSPMEHHGAHLIPNSHSYVAPVQYGLVTFLSDRRNRRAGATQTVTLNLTAVRSDKNEKLLSKKITENEGGGIKRKMNKK